MDSTFPPIKRILLLGTARSGTSWTASVINSDNRGIYANEPDSHFRNPAAAFAKQGLGIFPVIDEEIPPNLAQLWLHVFDKHRSKTTNVGKYVSNIWPRIPGIWKDYSVSEEKVGLSGNLAGLLARHSDYWQHQKNIQYEFILAKSVHAPFYAKPLVNFIKPDSVVVNFRPIEEIIASWVSLDYWPLGVGQTHVATQVICRHTKLKNLCWPTGSIERIVWSVTAMQLQLLRQANDEGWITLNHIDACLNPSATFKQLFENIELKWTDAQEQHLQDSDKVGKSYDGHRIRKDESGKWKKRLPPEAVERIAAELAKLNIQLSS